MLEPVVAVDVGGVAIVEDAGVGAVSEFEFEFETEVEGADVCIGVWPAVGSPVGVSAPLSSPHPSGIRRESANPIEMLWFMKWSTYAT